MTNHVIEVFQRRLKRALQMFRVIPLWQYPKAFLFLSESAVYQVLSFIWGGTLANRLLGKHSQTLTIVQTKFRFSLVGGDLGVVFDCLIDGMYEKKAEFIPHDGAVCLDIGACLAAWYRRCKPRKVIAAEPHPVTCERLRYNAALNRWNGLEIIEAAISSQEGEIVISLTPEGSVAVVGAQSAHQAQGTYTVTWRYTNGFGNTSTQTQTVIVKDTMPPVPDAVSLPTLTGERFISVGPAPTATDACVGAITGTTADPLTYTTQGARTVTWTFDDGNGNVSAQTVTVTASDVITVRLLNSQGFGIAGGLVTYEYGRRLIKSKQ
jgi:FkbM family methyltransferase